MLGLNLRKTDVGLIVDEVPRGGPAFSSGFLPGDLVVAINGELITEIEELSEVFVDLLPGEKVKVDFSRGGSKLTKTVKLARLGDIYLNERR